MQWLGMEKVASNILSFRFACEKFYYGEIRDEEDYDALSQSLYITNAG